MEQIEVRPAARGLRVCQAHSLGNAAPTIKGWQPARLRSQSCPDGYRVVTVPTITRWMCEYTKKTVRGGGWTDDQRNPDTGLGEITFSYFYGRTLNNHRFHVGVDECTQPAAGSNESKAKICSH